MLSWIWLYLMDTKIIKGSHVFVTSIHLIHASITFQFSLFGSQGQQSKQKAQTSPPQVTRFSSSKILEKENCEKIVPFMNINY